MIKIKPKVTEKTRGNAKSADNRVIMSTLRGRPPTGKAMPNAQRQAKFKALKKAFRPKS